MTSGGDSFNDFPENRLTKFRAIRQQKKNYFRPTFSRKHPTNSTRQWTACMFTRQRTMRARNSELAGFYYPLLNLVEQLQAVDVFDGRGRFNFELKLDVLNLGQQTIHLGPRLHRQDGT